MHKKSLIFILTVLLLFIISCSTFSPFMNGKSYSLLPLVFSRETDTVVIVSLENKEAKDFVLFLYPELNDFINRSSFITIGFLEDGTILGAFEGYYPIDSIRLLTRKNRAVYGEFSVFSPDGGIVVFTTGDVKEAQYKLFENRIERESLDNIKDYYSHSISIYGKGNDVSREWFSSIIGVDKTYMDFNKIDITFDLLKNTEMFSNNFEFLLNGTLDYNTFDDAEMVGKVLKASLVAKMREKRLSINTKEIDKRLERSSSSLEFHNFPLYFFYNL